MLTSRQYDFHYNMSLLMAEQLKRAGFKVDLNVVDWATLVQRRNDAKLWDIYVTHSGQFPEPMLSPPQLGDGAPGWWDTPAKKAALQAFNVESDPAKRGALWGKVQQVVYEEVPYINVGKFNGLSARSDLAGLVGQHRGRRPDETRAAQVERLLVPGARALLGGGRAVGAGLAVGRLGLVAGIGGGGVARAGRLSSRP